EFFQCLPASPRVAGQKALAILLGGWAENAFAFRRRHRPGQLFRMLQQPTKKCGRGWDLRLVGIPYPSDPGGSLRAECLAGWAGHWEFEARKSGTEGARIEKNLRPYLFSTRAEAEQ